MDTLDKVKENYLRRQAERLGLELRKSRIKKPHWDDFGGYMIVNVQTSEVLAGEKFDLDGKAAENFLNQYEKQIDF